MRNFYFPPKAPGSYFDLSRFKLTVPLDYPTDSNSNADEIGQADLPTWADSYFFLDDSNRMVMTAPVQAATTGGSGGTRCELREMEPDGTESAWDMRSAHRIFTVSGIFDPTSCTDRKEMIAGQIHATGGTPPLYFAVEHHVATPRLRLYKDGPGVANLLTGLTATTQIAYQLLIGGGRVRVKAVIGDQTGLAAAPVLYDFAATEFAEFTNCYMKCGAYNKSDVADGGTGESIATITYISLEQWVPATVSRPSGSFFFGFMS